MCLAVPGKIVSVQGSTAVVDFGGVQRETNISLVEAKAGDYVIVHAGFAIQIVDEEDARETIKLWEELLAFQQEA
jgi:hydrogenase expression/formation protein HypC